MKKLLFVFMIVGFVGLAFAYTPSNISNNSKQNQYSMMDDTTKTKKETTTKKDCPKKSCCKSKCHEQSQTGKEKKKEN